MRLLLFFILLSIGVNGQIVRCNQLYKSNLGTLFLDIYPSATIALSLRKLNSNYSGSCIRVRRSSDNTEQDIGFINNAIDTASMKTFVGANNGFVVTWYDQSGSGNDATQATAASQPKIITSGVVNRQGGIICINTATSLSLSTSSVLFNGGTFSFITAIGSHTNSNNDFFGNRFSTLYGWSYIWRTTGTTYQFSILAGTPASITNSILSKHIGFITRVGTTSSYYLNSTNSSIVTSIYNYTSATFKIGTSGTAGIYANANIFEVIGYTSDKGTNRNAMETNLNTYYSIY